MEYEKRIVCFMDLLGFKKMIKDSTENLDIRNKILKLLQDINEVHNNVQESRNFTVIPESKTENGFNPKRVFDSGLQSEMSFFSDSVIFSYKLTQQREDLMDVIMALHEISFFVFQMLSMGFFVRGGLSYGDVYHKGNICFGPALVKSVSLEETAIYPRISIDPCFFNENMSDSVYYGKTSISKRNRDYLEDTYHCVDTTNNTSSYKKDIWEMRKDIQFIHFLDILDININYDKSVALHIKSVIENELRKNYPQNITEKYVWIKEYYNSVVYNVQCMENVRIEM
ncbi:MAG: hypothetical protein IJ282_03535 [Lachnospiraceae bacterium]|nr:hypothetical protein [Lachnospiraceae bacterium]